MSVVKKILLNSIIKKIRNMKLTFLENIMETTEDNQTYYFNLN